MIDTINLVFSQRVTAVFQTCSRGCQMSEIMDAGHENLT